MGQGLNMWAVLRPVSGTHLLGLRGKTSARCTERERKYKVTTRIIEDATQAGWPGVSILIPAFFVEITP